MRARSFPLLLTAALALAACNPYEFNKPVGSEIDEGGFGNATMNNELLMTGKIEATAALGNRFATEVPSTITFDFNSSQLTEAARTTLRQQADWIRQFPEVRFRVYGHTDLVGSDAYNKSLGLRRAQAVVAYFGSLGISTARLEAVVSYGKTQPVIPTPGPEERNRRTVTEVSGFVNDHDMLLNGKYAAIIMREYINNAVRPHPANTDITTQVDPAAGQ
jgi:outer membrane protein OmpA-like peptidoglycan-associated protein